MGISPAAIGKNGGFEHEGPSQATCSLKNIGGRTSHTFDKCDRLRVHYQHGTWISLIHISECFGHHWPHFHCWEICRWCPDWHVLTKWRVSCNARKVYFPVDLECLVKKISSAVAVAHLANMTCLTCRDHDFETGRSPDVEIIVGTLWQSNITMENHQF